MQRNKITKDFSELKPILLDTEKMTSSLTDMMNVFNVKKHFSLFDVLKSKGKLVSSLLSILIILPFYGVASIYAFFKSGIKEIDGKKDAYYEIKNNENINWRLLLMLHAKRFKHLINSNLKSDNKGITALIFDDTLIEQTGKKTEKVSVVNDHVSGSFILGYKLLVCGFWDGGSFIPLDFSLHREKGNKQNKLIEAYKKSERQVQKIQSEFKDIEKSLTKKKISLEKLQLKFQSNPTKTNQKLRDQLTLSVEGVALKLEVIKMELANSQKSFDNCKRDIKKYYAKDTLFGLTKKERQAQFKKNVATGCPGQIRRKETDIGKIENTLSFLKRVVKNGFLAKYVLCDSWFFCHALLETITTIKHGAMKLISMVKINNQLFTDSKGRKMSVKKMPELYRKNIQKCRKLKSQYIKIACFYQDIRVNLFYVKMGKASTWHLLLTTDLEINFMQLMEVYQIRWSIEVFFKESKQYLNLNNCKSTIFDGHIADLTISMMQHIMLSYFKRINYMQSLGGLFKDISKECVELDLVTRLLEIFWDLVQILCDNAGFDFIAFREDALNDEKLLQGFLKLIPDKTFDKAA